MLTATVLGSGTSSGVPTIACTCPTCVSTDPKDKRLRPSVWLHSDTQSVVIDTSSDFREQCLRYSILDLNAIVYTHHHFDHIAGFDDLRAFNFKYRSPVRIFLMKETLEHVRHVFSYAFPKEEMPESGIPVVEPIIIDQESFRVGNLEFQPLPLRHGRLRVNGYRIGDLAYCTDCNAVTDLAIERMTGVRTLILDALRFTHHPTHFTLDQAIEVATRIGAETTYFTHIAHEIKHTEVEESLPEHMHLAYDGLRIAVDTDA